jgi:hypothetical protein
MWKFLSNMPHELSFAIIISGIIAIVIISLRGHLKAIFGKKTIELGGGGGGEKDGNGQETAIILKRSCGDCILLLMGEREKYEFQIDQVSNKVLKTQMTFVEQKLTEIQTVFMQKIIDAIHDHMMQNPEAVSESIQYKLVYGLLKDALINIKDEYRRSFKENGFYYLDNSDFSHFINEKVTNMNSILVQFIRNIFPDRFDIIKPHEVINSIEKEKDYFSRAIKDIYSFAQSTRRISDENILEIKNNFKSWIDDFSRPQEKAA